MTKNEQKIAQTMLMLEKVPLPFKSDSYHINYQKFTSYTTVAENDIGVTKIRNNFGAIKSEKFIHSASNNRIP